MRRGDLIALGLGLGVLAAVFSTRQAAAGSPAAPDRPPTGGGTPDRPSSTADDVRTAYQRWRKSGLTADRDSYVATYRAVYGKDPPADDSPPP